MGRILVYHSVAPEGDRVEQATQVSARRFREQLIWLQRAGYEFVTLAALAAGWPGGSHHGDTETRRGKDGCRLERLKLASAIHLPDLAPPPRRRLQLFSVSPCLRGETRRAARTRSIAITFDD